MSSIYSLQNKERATLIETSLIYSSFILLLLSCIDDGFVGTIIKIFWLASMGPVCFINFGAAFGLYVSSVAIYSVLHFQAWGSVAQRPDNYALLIFVTSLIFGRLSTNHRPKLSNLTIIIILFLAYILLQTFGLGLMTRVNFAWIMRMFGLPFLIFLLLMEASLSIKELRAFFSTVTFLGVYMVVISVFERVGLYSFVVPPWIGDPNLNVTIGSGRSGGTLLQSEWNGLALGLVYCIISGYIYMDKKRLQWLKYGAGILCLIGIFFTFTRAAWLAIGVAWLILLFRPLPKDGWKHIKRLGAISVACLLVALIIIFPMKIIQDRLRDEVTIYFRINMWASGIKMAIYKPLFGYGFGQFKENIYYYHEPIANVTYKAIPKEGQVAHNTLLDILIEQGILGLIMYGIIILKIFIKGRKGSFSLWPREGGAWVLAFSVIYFLNIQFVNAHEPTCNLIYYGTMGIIAGYAEKN